MRPQNMARPPVLTVLAVGVLVTMAVVVTALPRFSSSTDQVEAADGATLELDMVKDGDTWCDPVDPYAPHPKEGTYEVAICLTDASDPPRAFDVDVTFDPNLNECQPVECSAPCLDGNPDANDGSTTWGTDLGDGWDCSSGGFNPPRCDNINGFAQISCVNSTGPWTLPKGAGVSAPVAVVTFEAIDEGSDTLGLANVAFYGNHGMEMGSCNPTLVTQMPCIGGMLLMPGETPGPTATPFLIATVTSTPSCGGIGQLPCSTPMATPTVEPEASVDESGSSGPNAVAIAAAVVAVALLLAAGAWYAWRRWQEG